MAGVRDTQILDLITRTDEQVKLIMIETRPWDSDDKMYSELQDKLNNYLTYIEDGQLLTDYPEAASLKKVIRLDSAYEPSEYALLVINKISDVLLQRGIDFEFSLLK